MTHIHQDHETYNSTAHAVTIPFHQDLLLIVKDVKNALTHSFPKTK
jgi:hypothetical protein